MMIVQRHWIGSDNRYEDELNAYFHWSSTVVGQVLALSKPAHLSNTGWVYWPRIATEGLVRGWFNSCINRLLRDFTDRRYTGSPTTPLRESNDQRKKANREPGIFLCDDPASSNLPLNGTGRKRQKTSRTVSVTPASVNRVHTRLITTKGRPITTFRSNRELLLALHDAIKAHRSLLRHGILHRDSSVNNVMITLGLRSDGFQGFLIDLDLARRIDDTTDTTARHWTGTMEFMAIRALVPLVWVISVALFPVGDWLFTGTDPEAEPVYDRMFNAITEAVEEIEGRV